MSPKSFIVSSVPITNRRGVQIRLNVFHHEVSEAASVDVRRHTTHLGTVLALFGAELDRLLEIKACKWVDNGNNIGVPFLALVLCREEDAMT